MARCFNVTGVCDPKLHYMVDIQTRLREIKRLVDDGDYFTINRARQYGKTTTLTALKDFLKNDYVVISLDFQIMGNADFSNEYVFSEAFAEYLIRIVRNRREPVVGLSEKILDELEKKAREDTRFSLRKLFAYLSDLCDTAEKPVVLIIDEVDSASNNQVFLDFLAQLRGYYLTRKTTPTFHTVILAGVYDVKNINRKIRPNQEHKINSPWNIAADFKVNMSFTRDDIAGMLREYELDHHIGMDVDQIAGLIMDYTSGYPFLVSRICKLMDEDVTIYGQLQDKISVWTKDGFLEAIKLLLVEKSTLFESLIGKLYEDSTWKRIVYSILFGGKKIVYSPDNEAIDIAMMFGFVKNQNGTVMIANRIFEMRLYNYFLSTEEAQNDVLFRYASNNKSQFVRNGYLDMKLVLKRFTEHFDSIYGDRNEIFDEEEGRRLFLLYLRPIINGTGNYYIEAETRNSRRMDIVVDYLGERSVIELKIWHGNAYNERGEEQLSDYLEYFHLQKGYMLSYNFNKKKKIGIREIVLEDKVLIEAVV